MAQIGNFDAEQVAPSQPFELLPAGWYPAQFIESEVKATKDGEGKYLSLTGQVTDLDPAHANRKIFVRLNLWNQNDQAVQIAQRDLSAICRACGVLKVDDSEALHMIPLAIKLKVRPAQGNYEASNEPCGFDAIGARFSAGAPAPVTKPAPSKTAPKSATPWKK